MIMLWDATAIIYDPSAMTYELQEAGTADEKPELPAECWNDTPIDSGRAWAELVRSCSGN